MESIAYNNKFYRRINQRLPLDRLMEAKRLNSRLSRTNPCAICKQRDTTANSRYCERCQQRYATPADNRHAIRDSFKALTQYPSGRHFHRRTEARAS